VNKIQPVKPWFDVKYCEIGVFKTYLRLKGLIFDSDTLVEKNAFRLVFIRLLINEVLNCIKTF